MIHHVRGDILSLSPTSAVIETGDGVGYLLQISLSTYEAMKEKLHGAFLTHLVIRETEHVLFGFATEEERRAFIALTSVNGVGPKTAQMVLSVMTPDEVYDNVASENETAFKSIKGVGPKTASQIILDLKPRTVQVASSTDRQGAISALVALGFKKTEAAKLVGSLSEMSSEAAYVTEALKISSK